MSRKSTDKDFSKSRAFFSKRLEIHNRLRISARQEKNARAKRTKSAIFNRNAQRAKGDSVGRAVNERNKKRGLRHSKRIYSFARRCQQRKGKRCVKQKGEKTSLFFSLLFRGTLNCRICFYGVRLPTQKQ